MNQNHVPTCVQLDSVVDPDYYVDLFLEGHLFPGVTPNPEAMDVLSEQ